MANIRESKKKDGTRYYKITVYLGEKDGAPIRKYKAWTPPLTKTGKVMTSSAALAECEKIANAWENELKGTGVNYKNVTIAELFQKWDELHIKIKPRLILGKRKNY